MQDAVRHNLTVPLPRISDMEWLRKGCRDEDPVTSLWTPATGITGQVVGPDSRPGSLKEPYMHERT